MKFDDAVNIRAAVVAFLLLCTTQASAETLVQFPSPAARTAADVASWVTAGTLVALDTQTSWDCVDRAHCFAMQGIRTGVVYGVVLTAKFTLHRLRPCAPDCGIDRPDTSFFSGHTALAFSTRGGVRAAVYVPLALSTGGLRVAAGKHWISDTLVGAGVGYAASFIR